MQYNDRDFKLKLIETLTFITGFLESHGLRYYAYGGTLLGAVRHKGFIPWDDDIDILVPREDYLKLLSLNDELSNTKYKLISPRDVGYYEMFAKIVDTHTTILEAKDGIYPIGVFVDIFPLDYLNESDDYIYKLQDDIFCEFHKYKSSIAGFSLKKFCKSLIDCDIVRLKQIVASLIRQGKSQHYLDKFFAYDCQLSESKGIKPICMYAPPFKGKIYKQEWFSSIISCPFETININIPVGYHDFLTLLYGDYMTLPPEDKRINHHYYFVDTESSKTIDEIKQIVEPVGK